MHLLCKACALTVAPVNIWPDQNSKRGAPKASHGLAAFAYFLMAACSFDPGSQKADSTGSLEAIRIEAPDFWTQEREAFVIKKDGSGFYERYLPFDESGNALNSVTQRVEFAAGANRFSDVHRNLKGLQLYFGDDVSRIDLRKFEGPTSGKTAFPCGVRTTDAGSFVVYWNILNLEEFAKDSNLPDMFVVDRGCQSKQAIDRIDQIKSAISTIRQLAGVSSR
jgi:hypothetical protein